MRIGIIGGGVSGLVAAHLLRRVHDITVFEARERIGGHVNTVDVAGPDGRQVSVDTGFIVFNERNYPLFSALLKELDVPSKPSNMSFGVRCDRTGVEYSSHTANTMFAQRRNLFRPGFHRMIRDILRFNREAEPAVRNGAGSMTLGEYLEYGSYSAQLAAHYLKPMGSALWSIPQGRVLEMPAAFFVDFFDNHGMLSVTQEPEWRVVEGGSKRYVDALIAPFRDRIRPGTAVRRVERHGDGVTVDGEAFDAVVMACHADQALGLLADPTPLEQDILGALPFQKNDVVLHTDTSVLPTRRAAWASWNYRVGPSDEAPATVTYNMNKLQTLDEPVTYCVTLNDTGSIDPARILYRTTFSHPRFTLASPRAQARRHEISGVGGTYYCGAYWGFGFHEDGVRSACEVARHLGIDT